MINKLPITGGIRDTNKRETDLPILFFDLYEIIAQTPRAITKTENRTENNTLIMNVSYYRPFYHDLKIIMLIFY